jgi:hypothetical protein
MSMNGLAVVRDLDAGVRFRQPILVMEAAAGRSGQQLARYMVGRANDELVRARSDVRFEPVPVTFTGPAATVAGEYPTVLRDELADIRHTPVFDLVHGGPEALALMKQQAGAGRHVVVIADRATIDQMATNDALRSRLLLYRPL